MKHPENKFSQNHSLKRLSCSAASGIKLNNIVLVSKQLRFKSLIKNYVLMFNFSKPDFFFPMKHPENEFSQNHSLKRLSCSAASGIKPNQYHLGVNTIKI